jgi:signal transduction histidine kinase
MRADPMVDGTPRTIPAPPRRRFPVRPSRVDLRGAIERCVERHRPAAGDRIVVFVPERLQVSADPDAFDEVLCALLSNALKFAPPRSPIHVTAISDESQVVITVRDAGPGLSREQRSRILGRSNGHRGERGLEKVCRYVELHGGRVWVERAPEGGAAFSFTFPRAQQQTRPRPVRAASA